MKIYLSAAYLFIKLLLIAILTNTQNTFFVYQNF